MDANNMIRRFLQAMTDEELNQVQTLMWEEHEQRAAKRVEQYKDMYALTQVEKDLIHQGKGIEAIREVRSRLKTIHPAMHGLKEAKLLVDAYRDKNGIKV